MGSIAPDPLPAGEIWVDVGNRTGPGVLDHHGGMIHALSSCELALQHSQDWVLDPIDRDQPVTLVLHNEPDLDAISAVWLILHVLSRGALPEPVKSVEVIVNAVNSHDQGFITSEVLDENWPLVIRTRLEIDADETDDQSKLQIGMLLLDATLELLTDGYDLATAAHRLVTPSVKSYYNAAQNQYTDDRHRGTEFIASLPIKKADKRTSPTLNHPIDTPSGATWVAVDGLLLEDPLSPLFKELARADRKNSSLGRGFSLLIVSRSNSLPGMTKQFYRHTISTDPQTGIHLQGLGNRLEILEQEHEERDSAPLLEGRQRVPPGTGRHGYNVASPWYDGRGHNFTIVDSPSVVIDGMSKLASILSPLEVLEAVMDYGKMDGN